MMPVLCDLVRTDALATVAAIVGRFYGNGLSWALALPLPDLVRWRDLMNKVRDAEPMPRVLIYRPR